jgi:hypothetical protein
MNVTVTPSNLQDLTNVTTRQSSSTLANKNVVSQAPCQQDFNHVVSDQDQDTKTSSTIEPLEQNNNTFRYGLIGVWSKQWTGRFT